LHDFGIYLTVQPENSMRNVPRPQFGAQSIDIRSLPGRKHKIFIRIKARMLASSIRRNFIPVVSPIGCCGMVML